MQLRPLAAIALLAAALPASACNRGGPDIASISVDSTLVEPVEFRRGIYIPDSDLGIRFTGNRYIDYGNLLSGDLLSCEYGRHLIVLLSNAVEARRAIIGDESGYILALRFPAGTGGAPLGEEMKPGRATMLNFRFGVQAPIREIDVVDCRVTFTKREENLLEGVIEASGIGDFLGDGTSTPAGFSIEGAFKLRRSGHLACSKFLD